MSFFLGLSVPPVAKIWTKYKHISSRTYRHLKSDAMIPDGAFRLAHECTGHDARGACLQRNKKKKRKEKEKLRAHYGEFQNKAKAIDDPLKRF